MEDVFWGPGYHIMKSDTIEHACHSLLNETALTVFKVINFLLYRYIEKHATALMKNGNTWFLSFSTTYVQIYTSKLFTLGARAIEYFSSSVYSDFNSNFVDKFYDIRFYRHINLVDCKGATNIEYVLSTYRLRFRWPMSIVMFNTAQNY